MTIKKFLTGKPGNIEEFAKRVKQENLPVSVLFHVCRRHIGETSILLSGEIIYSGGSREQVLARKDIRYSVYLAHKECEDGSFSVKGIVPFLKDKARADLEYLDKQKIPYDIVIFNELG